jgi:hypothetical protein
LERESSASRILGLLVASAKGSYDNQYNELTAMAAKVADHKWVVNGSSGDRDSLAFHADCCRKTYAPEVCRPLAQKPL